jgi:hypothetical protein
MSRSNVSKPVAEFFVVTSLTGFYIVFRLFFSTKITSLRDLFNGDSFIHSFIAAHSLIHTFKIHSLKFTH